MKKIISFLIVYIFTACQTHNNEQVIQVVNYETLQNIVNPTHDVLTLVNFWATWCLPCVEELPDFMAANKNYEKNTKFKMILVNLDKVSDLETKVKPFITKNNITTDVYLLDDNKRMNEWIPSFDNNWSGAIPATILYKNGKKIAFIEGSLTKIELEKLIENNL